MPRRSKYILYGYCQVHGWVEQNAIAKRDKKNVPYCPIPGCNRRLRLLPKNSHLREKVKEERNENV